MKKVMVRAWEIAKEAVNKFGGKVKEFFAESLKMAWAEIKGAVKMVELKGSEKQVKWAISIREALLNVSEKRFSEKDEKHFIKKGTHFSEDGAAGKAHREFKELVENEESAAWFINNFKRVLENDWAMSAEENFKMSLKDYDLKNDTNYRIAY